MDQPRIWTGQPADSTGLREALDAPSPALLWLIPVSLLFWGALAVGVLAALRG